MEPQENPRDVTRVLIVEDSPVERALLQRILARDPRIDVVGVAGDAHEARERIRALDPDVITLDVQMPGMDGLQFLRRLMRLHPMPVIMCSSSTEKDADVTIEALEIGAFDFVTKPPRIEAASLTEFAGRLIGKIRVAARRDARRAAAGRGEVAEPVAPVAVPTGTRAAREVAELSAVVPPRPAGTPFARGIDVIAIGSSTGGPEALHRVITPLPGHLPPIVIAQHIPAGFTRALATRLDQAAYLAVREAQDGELLQPRCAYVAPGGRHLVIERADHALRARLLDAPAVQYSRPSVDVLFRSVAQAVGPGAIGAILTGMGSDGAQGLLEMRQAGARTFAQDEASSLVWGMPGSAVRLGAAEFVRPLDEMSAAIVECLPLKQRH